MADSPAEFLRAIDRHVFERVDIDWMVREQMERLIEEAGLLVVGEPHGVRETTSVVYTLMSVLGIRTVAFEWSFDEIDVVVQRLTSDGSLDLEDMWALPASSEFFCGDGRITAGHFALLRRLREEHLLDRLVLLDRLDPDPAPVDWRPREKAMAERLLHERVPGAPLVALVGGFHAQLDAPDGTTMAMHLAGKTLTGSAMIQCLDGHGWSCGELYPLGASMPAAPMTLRLATGTPAIVPGKSTTV